MTDASGEVAGIRVLVVDDSPIMRKMVIHALKVAGVALADIQQAAHGGEALAVLEQQRTDIVLCDVHMPTMDGIELVRSLAGSGKLSALPVVMISSERNDAQQTELERLGIKAYVHKPFYPEALGQVVRGALGRTEAT